MTSSSSRDCSSWNELCINFLKSGFLNSSSFSSSLALLAQDAALNHIAYEFNEKNTKTIIFQGKLSMLPSLSFFPPELRQERLSARKMAFFLAESGNESTTARNIPIFLAVVSNLCCGVKLMLRRAVNYICA